MAKSGSGSKGGAEDEDVTRIADAPKSPRMPRCRLTGGRRPTFPMRGASSFSIASLAAEEPA